MGRLADQCDAAPRDGIRRFDGERKQAAAGFDAHPSEQRMGAALDVLFECVTGRSR